MVQKRSPAKSKTPNRAGRENKTFLQNVYNGAEYPSQVVDIINDGDFAVSGVNAAYQRVYQIREREVIGRRLSDVMRSLSIEEGTIQQVHENLTRCFQSGETVQYEATEVLEGKQTWWLTRLTPLQNRGGKVNHVVVTLINISARKRAEEALQAAEADYRALFDDAPIGVFRSTPEGQFLKVNRAMANMYGYASPEEMIAAVQSIPQQVYVDPSSRREYQATLAEKGEALDFEVQNRRKDGSVFWVLANTRSVRDKDGGIVYYEGFIEDISERKRVEADLRESEKLYRLLAENVSDVIWILDTETFRFRYVSPSVRQLRGYTVQEVMDQDISAAITSNSLQAIQRQIPGRIEDFYKGHSGPYINLVEQPRKDGTTVWTETTTHFRLNPDTNHIEVYGVSRDITERKQAEDVLREVNERLELTQIAAGAGAWDWDIVSNQIIWSPKMFELFGLDIAAVDASFETWRTVLHPEDLEIAEKRIEQALSSHSTLENEYRVVLPDGKIRWISALGRGSYNDQGQPVRMNGICFDITERKRMEDAVSESEKKFKTLFEIAPVGISVLDRERRIVDANAMLEKILRATKEGLARGDYKNRKYFRRDGTLMSPEDYASERAIQENRPVSGVETGVMTESGEVIWTEVSAAPLGLPNASVVIVTQDITKRRQAEEKLRESEARYDQLVRNIPIGVYILRARKDGSVNYEYVSPQFCQILDISEDAVLRNSDRILEMVHPDDKDGFALTHQTSMDSLQPHRWEGRFVIRGEIHWIRLEADATALPGGESLWNGVVSDVTARKWAEAETLYAATSTEATDHAPDQNQPKDPLTQAYTRASLDARLLEELERARRYGIPFSILFLDLDNFKSINDAFGHARGDHTLIEFAQRMQSMMRRADVLYRYGGDEFLLLLPQTTRSQALIFAQRLLDRIRAHPFPGEPPVSLTFSAGVANFPIDAQTLDALFEVADQRNYQAKRAGRGRVFGKDQLPDGVVELDEPSRIIEREQVLESVYTFLDSLPESKRGLFEVVGQPGSGKGRFLAEIRKVASLRGFATLGIRGSPALKARLYGALDEASSNWVDIPSLSKGEVPFVSALQKALKDNAQIGLVITVERLPDIDQQTLGFLRRLFASPTFPPLAIAFESGGVTTQNVPGNEGLPKEAPLRETVMLAPLSLDGVKIWLRHSLRWEPPPGFLEKLYFETGGQPQLIQRSLDDMLEKGILKRVHDNWVYREENASFPLSSQPIEPAPFALHNMPGLADMVGRRQEIHWIKDRLQERRPINVHGSGGVGKSRLTQQTAAESQAHFQDGVFFIPLEAMRDPAFLAPTLADHFHCPLDSEQDPKRQLINFLRHKALLAVLDDFDRLQDGTDLLTDILDQAPEVRIMVTSESPLNLPGAAFLELKGLPFPESDTAKDVEYYPATQLFFNRVKALRSDFHPSDDDWQIISQICRLLQGIPLGIELAAAWAQAYSLREIAIEIERNLSILATDLSKMSAREQGLNALFDSLWRLLFKNEQDILSLLTVFRGGFGADAAGQVASASPFFLDALVARNYLRRGARGRFEMPELLRQFIEEKYSTPPNGETHLQDRHGAYYLNLLGSYTAALIGADQLDALQGIGADIENVRMAWEWAVERCKRVDIGRGLDALFHFYDMRSWFREGAQAFERAVRALQSESQPSFAARVVIGKALARQGWFTFHLGNHAEARGLLQRSLDTLQGLDARAEMVFSLNYLGAIAYHQGEHTQTREYCQSSLALAHETGDRYGAAIALNLLGRVAFTMNEWDEAQRLCESSLSLARELGNRWSVAFSLEHLGQISLNQGKLNKAQQLFQQSLLIRHEIEDQRGVALCLNFLGDVAQALNAPARARHFCREALGVFRKIGNPLGVVQSLIKLGRVEYALKEFDQAQTVFSEALRLSLEIQSTSAGMDALLGIARIYHERGDAVRALGMARFVSDHIANNQEIKENAETLRDLLASSLPDDVASSAQSESKNLTLKEMIEKTLLI